jgi:hypothetical protein
MSPGLVDREWAKGTVMMEQELISELEAIRPAPSNIRRESDPNRIDQLTQSLDRHT